jgi:hypothetical protein
VNPALSLANQIRQLESFHCLYKSFNQASGRIIRTWPFFEQVPRQSEP